MRRGTYGLLAIVLAAGGAVLAAEEQKTGPDSPRYPTPQDCPGFANPQFISRPLEKAYPGLEYNIRPAIKGGRYPYKFSLDKAPEGMQIEPVKGTVKWIAPDAEGKSFEITVKVADSDGKTAVQEFKVLVSKVGFHFVGPDGDDANPGTIEKPWKTVLRVAKPPEDFTYPAGAVVCFRGGEYRGDVPAEAGKANANVIRLSDRSPKYWLAYPGEKPVIDLGWSGEKQKAVHDEQRAAGKKEPSTQGYGHRFSLGPGYFYFDGFEVKNACYYMFVMWNGENTVHFRRCDMHHLWCDWAENPGFIFTFAGDREGGREWGVRAKVKAYRNFVIQDNHFHDRVGEVPGKGAHGGAMTFYTVRDSLVEDCVIERVAPHGSMLALNDKDNGWDNTYRGNTIRGGFALLSQGCNDGIEICHNCIEGPLTLGLEAGWLRNIWIHHNTIRGGVMMLAGGTRLPDSIDEKSGDFSAPWTEDSRKAIRDFPREKKLVHFWRNILAAAGGEKPENNTVLTVGNKKAFAEKFRYVRWDENLVDAKGRIHVLWGIYKDWAIMTGAGFDAKGVVAEFALDAEGNLSPASPYLGQYGRQRPLTGK